MNKPEIIIHISANELYNNDYDYNHRLEDRLCDSLRSATAILADVTVIVRSSVNETYVAPIATSNATPELLAVVKATVKRHVSVFAQLQALTRP